MQVAAAALRDFAQLPQKEGRRPIRLILNRADAEQAYGDDWESAVAHFCSFCIHDLGYAEFEVSPEDPTLIVCLDAHVFKLDPSASVNES